MGDRKIGLAHANREWRLFNVTLPCRTLIHKMVFNFVWVRKRCK
jgi:hypothetical protein